MKRPSYRYGVQWIAHNDDAGNNHCAETIAGYVSTLLLADLFGVDPAKVARDILKERQK